VEATDETTAFTWIKKQKALPLAGQFKKSGAEKDLPPKVTMAPTFEPLVEGVMRGPSGTGRPETGQDLYNANLVRVRFAFTRLYEELTLPLE
jgi:hypothetical protein